MGVAGRGVRTEHALISNAQAAREKPAMLRKI